MALEDDVTPDEVEDAIAAALIKMASQGSVPAANAALSLIGRKRQSDASALHRQKITELRGDNLALAAYLGELGIAWKEAKETIGRETPDIQAAHERGATDRRIEMRAIALSRARNGDPLEPWMKA